MSRKKRREEIDYLASETGTITKSWRNRTRIALIYPNTYEVGMSNLGFQAVYRLFNEMEDVVCERAFLPDERSGISGPIVTVESRRPLTDFHIAAFSVSFENDYLNILAILEKGGIDFTAADRGNALPLVAAGGVACFLNPEPLAPFIDVFLLGEAEPLLPEFINAFDPGRDKADCLKTLVQKVEGIYVPSLYSPSLNNDGTLKNVTATGGAPERVKKVYPRSLSDIPTCSTVLTSHTTFSDTYLIEVSRGCPHGCRFCSAGFIYRPPRFRPLDLLSECIGEGEKSAKKIGLVGTAVSDLPDIDVLCSSVNREEVSLSFSSLRADALTPELVATLKKSGVKTATIAPEAGSERMRKVINKGITEDDILNAARVLVGNGIPNIKLYFMIGLPTETMTDIEAIVRLAKDIKQVFLETSREKKRIGELTVSLSSFVPKPVTPFQWAAMDSKKTLKKKIMFIRKALGRIPNVKVHSDSPGWSYIQAVLSRGDRNVSRLLIECHRNGGNWNQTFRNTETDPDFYALRERDIDELLPWDFIDHGIKKSFLVREYERAKANKQSPACPMKDCSLCGACTADTGKGID